MLYLYAGGRANWVQPRLVVEVEYREFNGRRLRHPALKALAAGVDAGLDRLPGHEH